MIHHGDTEIPSPNEPVGMDQADLGTGAASALVFLGVIATPVALISPDRTGTGSESSRSLSPFSQGL
jgi:hypothetical protein